MNQHPSDAGPHDGAGITVGIDKVTVGTDLRVEGWAFHHRYGPCRIEAWSDGAPPSPSDRLRTGISRRDVGLALGTPLADRSGFELAAVPPPNAERIDLRLTAGGEECAIPLLIRADSSPRGWQPAMGSGVAILEYRFLTGRGPHFATTLPSSLNRARAALTLFESSPRPAPPLAAPVTIIVPVYGGKTFLTPLTHCLLETVERRHRIIFVDDGNSDRAVTTFLMALGVSHDHVTVVVKRRNEGYPRAVAAGLEVAERLNPDGHVVLLNTDVEVPPGWLERLVGPIERAPWIASTTPLTNAGTICGFPTMPEDNAPFLGLPTEEIDAVLTTLSGVPPVELPTGVGFCMALNRRALRAIGGFDLEAFGRGYGEEVDWCRRALRHGFTNVAIPNLHVHHAHGGSFPSEEKQRLIQRSGDIIRRRYPEFDAEVQDFIHADPLRPVRAAAAATILGRTGRPSVVLLIDHAGGGGAAIFRAREVKRLHRTGQAVLLARPAAHLVPDMPEGALDIDLLLPEAGSQTTALRFPANGLDDLAALARVLPLAETVLNSLVGHDVPAMAAFIRTLRTERGVPLRLMHHDYFPICPSLNLIDAEGRYCGVPDIGRCRDCLPANPQARRWDTESPTGPAAPGSAPSSETPFGMVAYRRVWQDLFDTADRHIVFSKSALAVLRRAFTIPDERVRVIPHLVDHMTVTPLPTPPSPNPVARVAVIGGINVAKGSEILNAMVRLAEARRLPLIFELFGNIHRPIPSPHFHDNGIYEPEDLPRLLRERGCHAVFLPSIWPETYCYVLDEVVGLGLPVGVFDIGAPAERLRHWANGFLVTPIDAEEALSAILRRVFTGVKG